MPDINRLVDAFYSKQEKKVGITDVLKSEAKAAGVSVLQYTVDQGRINFQNYDRCKRAYNKCYGVKFGNLEVSSEKLKRLQSVISYRHKIVHVALERNREVATWLREAGHEPCSHGWRWEEVWRLSRDEEADHIRRAIESIEETCGVRPYGWYCRYGPSVHTRELLVEEGGFVYDSDAYNDDLPYHVDVSGTRHLVIPYSMTYNDAKFGSLPSYGSPADFGDNLKRGFDQLWAEGETHPRMMSIGLHPRLIGQASRIHALREFLEHAQKKGKVWFARRIDIANWWNEHQAEFGR